ASDRLSFTAIPRSPHRNLSHFSLLTSHFAPAHIPPAPAYLPTPRPHRQRFRPAKLLAERLAREGRRRALRLGSSHGRTARPAKPPRTMASRDRRRPAMVARTAGFAASSRRRGGQRRNRLHGSRP